VAIKAYLGWRASDSTSGLNAQSAQIIQRLVASGGAITLSASAMQLTLSGFFAQGWDGMVSVSDADETLTLPAPPAMGTADWHVILYSRHREGAAPISQLQIVSNAVYTTNADRDYFISFGKLTIPSGATTASACTLDLSTSDLSDPLGKSTWRPPVANVGALPASTAVATNRLGETRVVLSGPSAIPALYTWDGSAWVASGGGTALLAHLSVKEFADAERARNEERSGLLATTIGLSPTSENFAGNPAPHTYFDLFVPQGSLTSIGLKALKALVNGHYIETKAQTVTTLTKPGGSDRYDLVYLVVTRTTLANPDVNNRPTYPSGNLTRAQVDALAGLNTSPDAGLSAGVNYDLLNQEIPLSTPTAYATINATIAYQDSVDPTEWLQRYGRGYTVTAPISLGGFTYTQKNQNAGDPFLFTAPDGATVDGIRYMIPLLLLRRRSTETQIDTYFLDGQRQAFPIHPNTRSAQRTMVQIGSPYASSDSAALAPHMRVLSGIRQGIEEPITSVSNQLNFPPMLVTLGGETLQTTGFLTAPLPPTAGLTGTTSNDVAYDFVYLRLTRTAFPVNPAVAITETQPGSPVATLYTSSFHIQNGPQLYASTGEGAYCLAQFVSVRITDTDFYPSLLEEALEDTTLVGFQKAGIPTQDVVQDPGQWLRSLGTTSANNPLAPIDGSAAETFARVMPLALVRRRNPGTFSNTNLNGTVGRPDGKSSDLGVIYPDEILDLRSRVVDNPAELDGILTTTMDRLIRGTLQTQFSAHPLAPRLFAGKHLLLARISGSGSTGYDTFAPPDNYRGLWSSANESYPICQIFSPAVNGTAGVVTWSSAGTPSLTVRAPSQAYILTATNPAVAPDGELRPRWTTGPWYQQYFRPASQVSDPTALFPDPDTNRSQELGDIYSPTLLCVSAQLSGQVVLDYQAISNTGPGWHPYTNVSVFEPFYHASTYNWTVVNSDGAGAFTGHPIEMNKTGAGYGSIWIITQAYATNTGAPLCAASYWCMWPQPNYADSAHVTRYQANKGFLMEPETIHTATLTVGATTAKVAVGMPFSDVEITLGAPLAAGSPLDLSQVAMFGALPAGTYTGATGIVFYGVADVQVTEAFESETVVPAQVNIANDGLSGSIRFSANYGTGTVIRVRCMVRPVNPAAPWDWVWWVEANRANRSVRGLFRYGLVDCKIGASTSDGVRRITTFMAPLPGSPLAPTAGLTSLVVPFRDVGAPNTLSPVELPRSAATAMGTQKIGPNGTVGMYLRPTSTPTGDYVTRSDYPNTLGVSATTTAVTNLMSPFVDVVFGGNVGTGLTAQDVLFVGVVQDMLNTNCTLVMSYTASAYQGTVTGNPNLSDPPVVGLKRRVLGTVMAVGQIHSTTAGSGMQTYALSVTPRTSTTPVFAVGTMPSPGHVTGMVSLAVRPEFSSFRYQQYATFGTGSVRPDRAGHWPFPGDKPMLTNVVQRLPGGMRAVALTSPQVYAGEESYAYQELALVASSFGTVTGAGITLRKQPNSDAPTDGSQPIAVGDVYAYPASWSGPETDLYEASYYRTSDDPGVRSSRGLTLATTPPTAVGQELNPAFVSWLAPLNTANPFQAWATGNPTKASLIPPSLTMEGDPGVSGVPYAQAYGVLVDPSTSDMNSSLQGRLHVLVGANAAVGADRAAYQNTTGTTIPAGNAFDVIIPVGRPIIARR